MFSKYFRLTDLTLEDVPDLDEHAEVGVENPDSVGEDVFLVEVGDLAVVEVAALLDHLQAAAHRGQPAPDEGEHLAFHQRRLEARTFAKLVFKVLFPSHRINLIMYNESRHMEHK